MKDDIEKFKKGSDKLRELYKEEDCIVEEGREIMLSMIDREENFMQHKIIREQRIKNVNSKRTLHVLKIELGLI